jgi:AcrR family transcriptional regulator
MSAKAARTTYRHGNLTAAALDAAYDLVARGERESSSLRQAAEAVGVVHRSLYNHFRDREALLDAVASEGFTRLGAVPRHSEREDLDRRDFGDDRATVILHLRPSAARECRVAYPATRLIQINDLPVRRA